MLRAEREHDMLQGNVFDGNTLKETAERVMANVARAIIGKGDVIELCLVAILCQGHVLIEDVPGIGKTTLAKAIARSTGCVFRRIQFTPDLLPSDVTGISFFNQKTQEFEFRPGPVLTQVLLADEINRATPRTQSALLEAMQEQQITVDGETIALPRPFLVLATENPIELEGTFPLPEAQLDRFMLRVKLGYPGEDDEQAIVQRYQSSDPLASLQPVTSAGEILAMERAAQSIHVDESVRRYIVQAVRATRANNAIQLGASPRASLFLYRGAQALAGIRGRSFVIPDDVKYLAPATLSHRIMISPQARLRGRSKDDIIAEIVGGVPVPVESGA
jgi:MoxR-like ATPase